MGKELRCYLIEDGEYHWYSAYSEEDAYAMHEEEFELDPMCKEDMIINVCDESLELTVVGENDDGVTKQAFEWVEQRGRCLICSTAY